MCICECAAGHSGILQQCNKFQVIKAHLLGPGQARQSDEPIQLSGCSPHVQSDQRKELQQVCELDHLGDLGFPSAHGDASVIRRERRLNLPVPVGISSHRNLNPVGSSFARASRRAVTLCLFAPDPVAGA